MKKRLIGSLLFGALIMSSSSVFVSCADYDDDINANKAEIVAAQNEIAKLSSSLSALETELKTTKTNLESQLSTLESSFKTQIADAEGRLNKAIATKADQATVDNLIKEVNDLKAAYEANKAAVQAKIDAIDKDIDTLEALIATKADQSALDAAIQTLTAAINGKVDPLIGLKENVLIGKLIPAGTGMSRYRSLKVVDNDPKPAEESAEDVTTA